MSVRPGVALLQSLVAEERRGRPGPARDAALAAATSDPSDRAAHVLDAVYASLVAGEPKRAVTLLDQVDAGGEAHLDARVAACRAWAGQLDHNWYPGGTGAELSSDWMSKVTFIAGPTSPDPETRLVEAVVSLGPVPLLTARSNVDMAAASFMGATQQLLGIATGQLDEFAAVASATASWGSEMWARLAQADLAWRAGVYDVAGNILIHTRDAAASAGDAVGLACTHMVEGDWWCAPGATPDTGGLRLVGMPTATMPPSDLARSVACYTAAAAALQGVDESRAAGALALRFAHIAAVTADVAAVDARLAEAATAFAAAGDTSACHLVTIHRIIADLAADRTAATRRSAGCGWSLEARGPIATIVEWSQTVGSSSYCTGLAHLLGRVGDGWRATGEYERAAVAYSCAVPLIGASGAVPPGRQLAAIGIVDGARNLNARAAVRFAQAGEHMPAAPSPDVDPALWLEHLQLLTSIAQAQTATLTSSPTAASIRSVERLVSDLQELAGLAEVSGPPTHVSFDETRAATQAIQDAVASKDFDQLSADTNLTAAQQAAPFLAQAMPALQSQIGMYSFLLSLSRARLAARGGWTHESTRWFDDALRQIEDGSAPGYMAVSALVASGRDDEARERFEHVRSSGFLPDETIAILALRAREYTIAEEIFSRLGSATPELDWVSLADRAESALEVGDPARSVTFATAAIEQLESNVGRISRDPDRVAATDDVKVAALYLVACRAHASLARSDPSHHAHCLALVDRARSLALMGLVDRSDVTGSDHLRRRWHEAATNWSAAFERLRACYDSVGQPGRDERSAELTAADDLLTDVEAELESIDAGVLNEPLLPPALDVDAVQAALSTGACLVEYLLVGRELLVVAATSDEIVTAHARLDHPGIEPLVSAMWRACSDGSPGDEARRLGELLLDPISDLLTASRRVIVVPFGPLNAVPFHALPFGAGLLGDDHIVSYLPTAALLVGEHLDAPVELGRSLVVGDPAYDPARHPTLERLEGAAVEARVVAEILRADALVAEAAQESSVRAQLDHRSIVHLAAHGHLDDVAPSTSSIVLADADELTVADLIGLRIDADLAVLSACDSGRGTATLGGDLVGLTRGLIAAGVRRCVVSLWPVDDVAACVTMAVFYHHLVGGEPPALALWNAQRELRTLSADEIAARYRSMGGTATSGDRSRRRGMSASADAAAADDVARVIALHDDFVDPDDDAEEGGGPEAPAPGGQSHRIWAPFILIGA